jgi:hypothetical protein
MLLILEIILTVQAWRRGYGFMALLPVGLAIAIGFFIGMANPEAVENAGFLEYIWLDILAVVALVIMIAAAPKIQEDEAPDYNSEPVNEVSESFHVETEISKN